MNKNGLVGGRDVDILCQIEAVRVLSDAMSARLMMARFMSLVVIMHLWNGTFLMVMPATVESMTLCILNKTGRVVD